MTSHYNHQPPVFDLNQPPTTKHTMTETKKFIENDEIELSSGNIYTIIAAGTSHIGVLSPGGSKYLWDLQKCDHITLHSRHGFKIGDHVTYDNEVYTITNLNTTGVGLKQGVNGVANAPYDQLKPYTPPQWTIQPFNHHQPHQICCIDDTNNNQACFYGPQRHDNAHYFITMMNQPPLLKLIDTTTPNKK